MCIRDSSGADRTVRDAVQNNVIRNAENKIIFVIDNDNSQGADDTISTGCGNCIDALSGDVNLLCEDLLEMTSVQNISRFRTMLCDLGFDPLKTMKVVQYISFIKETEHRLGNESKSVSYTHLDVYKRQKLHRENYPVCSQHMLMVFFYNRSTLE